MSIYVLQFILCYSIYSYSLYLLVYTTGQTALKRRTASAVEVRSRKSIDVSKTPRIFKSLLRKFRKNKTNGKGRKNGKQDDGKVVVAKEGVIFIHFESKIDAGTRDGCANIPSTLRPLDNGVGVLRKARDGTVVVETC